MRWLLLLLVAWASDPVALRDAIDAGTVNVELRGNGSSTGDAIFATIRGTGPAATLNVAAGTVLTAASAEAPRMVIASLKGRMLGYGWLQPATAISVTPDGSAQWVFEAYAIDFDKRHPQKTDRYTVGEVDDRLAALIATEEKLKSGPAALQTAIWASNATFDLAGLRERYPANDKILAATKTLMSEAGQDPCAHPIWQAGCVE